MDNWWIELCIMFGVLLGIFLLYGWWCRATVSHETITVSDKGIVVNGYGGSEVSSVVSNYMVYTTNGQALKNTNNIWFWKFHSDELQGKLKKGKKYKIKTWGLRIKWLGMYKHIISATEVKVSSRKKAVKK